MPNSLGRKIHPMMEGIRHVTCGSSFESKAWQEGPTSIRGRRIVIVAGERRLCGPGARSRNAHAEQRRWQSSHAR